MQDFFRQIHVGMVISDNHLIMVHYLLNTCMLVNNKLRHETFDEIF